MGIALIKNIAGHLTGKLRRAVMALGVAAFVAGGAAFAVPNCAKADDCCGWVFMPGTGAVWWCWCNSDGPADNGL
jgi:hypothetical protein